MASHKYQQDVHVNVHTHINDKDLVKLQAGLKLAVRDARLLGGALTEEMRKGIQSANQLERALQRSFDVRTGTISMRKLNQEIKGGLPQLLDMGRSINNLGPRGQESFNNVLTGVLQVNKGMRQTNEFLNKMGTTMANTVRWGISAAIFQRITGEAQAALRYTIELDKVLHDIRIVSDLSSESMKEFAISANSTAQALGASTKAYSEAALIFFQQGLGQQASEELAKVTVMAANVTGQTAEDVSNQLTGIWNGYQVATSEAETYVDKMAAVAAATAADLEEMSTAINKTAAAAKSSGVEFDQLNAMVATTVSVTKQAPESVGTAYKTIFARLGDLTIKGKSQVDGFTVTLGQISEKLSKAGISIVDANGNMRDMGDVINEIGGRWQDFDRGQKQAIATTIGGKRQWNYVMALFENWDMYTKQLNVSQESFGTLQKQNSVYLQSAAGKMETMKAAQEGLYNSLLKIENINSVVEIFTKFLNVLTKVSDTVGGIIPLFVIGLTTVATILRGQIFTGIANAGQRFTDFIYSNNRELDKFINSLNRSRSTAKAFFAEIATAEGKQLMRGEAGRADLANRYFGGDQAAMRQVQTAKKFQPFLGSFTPEQQAQYQGILEQQKQIGLYETAETRELQIQNQLKQRQLDLDNQIAAAKKAGTSKAKIKEQTAELRQEIATLEEDITKWKARKQEMLDSGFDVGEANVAVTEDSNDLQKNARRQQLGAAAVGGTVAIAGLGMALDSAGKSLANWNEMSSSDKTTAVFTNIAMVVPGFVGAMTAASGALSALGITGGAAMAALGPIGAILGALSIGFMLMQKSAQENKKAIEDAIVTYDKTKDELNNLKNAQESYQAALKTYRETGKEKEKLIAVATELSDVYGDESIKLKALAGDYEAVNKFLKERLATTLALNMAAATKGAEKIKEEGTLNKVGGSKGYHKDVIRLETEIKDLEQRLKFADSEGETYQLTNQLKTKQNLLKELETNNKFTGDALENERKKLEEDLLKLELSGKTDKATRSEITRIQEDLLVVGDALATLATYEGQASDIAAGMIEQSFGDKTNMQIEDTASNFDLFNIKIQDAYEGWISTEKAMVLYNESLINTGKLSKEESNYLMAQNTVLNAQLMSRKELLKVSDKLGKTKFTATTSFIEKTGQKLIPSNFNKKENQEGAKALIDMEKAQVKLNKATQAYNKDKGNPKAAENLRKAKVEANRASTAYRALYIQARLLAGGINITAAAAGRLAAGLNKLNRQQWDAANQKKTIQELIKYFDALGNSALVAATKELYAMNVKKGMVAAMEAAGAAGPHGAATPIDEAKIKKDALQQTKDVIGNFTEFSPPKGSFDGSTDDKKKKDKSGGGGGGKEKYTPDKMDYITSEIDKYQKVDNKIKLLTNSFDKLAKAQDKLVGKQLIANLNAQVALIGKQIAAQKEKLAIQEKERKSLAATLRKSGVSFDKEGNITNYAAKVKAAENKVNAAIRKYNATKTEKGQQAQKAVVDKAQKQLDALKANIDKYDTLLYDEIAASKSALEELETKRVEIAMQKFSIQVEAKLSFSELQKKFNEFQNIFVQGLDMDKAANKVKASLEDLTSYFNSAGTGNIDVLSESLAKVNREVSLMQSGGSSSIFGKDMAAATAKQKELYEQLIAASIEYKQQIKNIKGEIVSMAQEGIDALNKAEKSYAMINASLDHQSKLIKLLYGNDAYDEMEKYYEAQEMSNTAQVAYLQQQVAVLTEARAKVSQTDNPELWDTYTNAINDAQSSLDSLIESSVQNLLDRYSNTVSKIMTSFTKDLTGGLLIEDLETQWKRITSQADKYLDSVSGAYEMSKLEYKVSAANSNLTETAQVKLNSALSQQLTMLREKDKLTKYDVERANKIIDLEIKKIALQNAQNAKTSMSLKRNAQGGYSYVYSANAADTQKAREDLLDAQQAVYEQDKTAYKNNLEEMRTSYAEWDSAIRAIANDATLSESERQAKMQEINTYYGDVINGIVSQNETIRLNYKKSTFDLYKTLYGEDSDAYKRMLEDQDAAMIEIDKTWNSSIQGMIDSIGPDGFQKVAGQLYDKLMKANRDYTKDVDKLKDAAKLDFADVGKSIAETTKATDALKKSTDPLITNMQKVGTEAAKASDKLKGFMTFANNASRQAAALAQNANAAVRALAEFTAGGSKHIPTSVSTAPTPDIFKGSAGDAAETELGSLIEGFGGDIADIAATLKDDGKLDKLVKARKAADEAVGKPYLIGTQGPDTFDCSGLVTWVLQHAGLMDGGGRLSTDDAPGRNGFIQKRGKYLSIGHIYRSERGGRSNYGHMAIKLGDTWYEAGDPVKKYEGDRPLWKRYLTLPGYDTGGYTGSWGSSGKPAILHEKELVLNKEDTVNMLATVSAVRDMAGNFAVKSGQTLLSMVQGNINPNINQTPSKIEQKVQIQADFPNVSNADEIEKAFNNLINVAAQYVN